MFIIELEFCFVREEPVEAQCEAVAPVKVGVPVLIVGIKPDNPLEFLGEKEVPALEIPAVS